VLVAAGRQSNTAAGINTIPEVSMVGETEESLQKKGTAYIAGRANYRENARGRIIGDQDGFLKLLFRQGDLKLIGVHVMGELATEVVHIGLIAMMCDASANLFVEAGVTSGALALVEQDLGSKVALAVARQLVLFLRRRFRGS
jgi:pyruvate/2-oxoglutarate dehydrogenase complex dihydrolipoamide dehydrogenase (E3) component